MTAKEILLEFILGNNFVNKPSLRDKFVDLVNSAIDEGSKQKAKDFEQWRIKCGWVIYIENNIDHFNAYRNTKTKEYLPFNDLYTQFITDQNQGK